jgi:hypothetical protein
MVLILFQVLMVTPFGQITKGWLCFGIRTSTRIHQMLQKWVKIMWLPVVMIGPTFQDHCVKVRTCPLGRRVRHNSKNIWPRLLIFGVWVSHVVEQFPIENQPIAILAFTYIFISVSLFTISFTRCSVTVQMFHRMLCRPGAFSDVLALTVVLVNHKIRILFNNMLVSMLWI